jgi:hypothetical protein
MLVRSGGGEAPAGMRQHPYMGAMPLPVVFLGAARPDPSPRVACRRLASPVEAGHVAATPAQISRGHRRSCGEEVLLRCASSWPAVVASRRSAVRRRGSLVFLPRSAGRGGEGAR